MNQGGIFAGNVLGASGLGDPITIEPVEIIGDVPDSSEPDKFDQIVTGFQAGAACSSDPVIQYVQAVIGTTIDGKWGPKSEAALKAFGKTFEQIAVGCKPPAPHYVTSSQSTASLTPLPTSQTAEPQKIAGESQAGFSDIFSKIPTIAWIGLAGIAGLLLLKSSKQKREV